MNGEEPIMTFMMLPSDLVLNCLARVSILYYPTLSLVSKTFLSLIASKELYKTRTLLGRTESCVFVSLFSTHDYEDLHWFILCRKPKPNPKPRWFTLCFRPNQKSTKKKKSNANALISISSTKFCNMLQSSKIEKVWPLCVIDDVLYRVTTSDIEWYDFKENRWRILNGLKGNLPRFIFADVRLADYGGKLAVLWHVDMLDKSKILCKILCAEITLERRNEYEIWGKVEWFDTVFKHHLDGLDVDIMTTRV